ncbi:helix-turn-helix transcriptional regulator [Micromonospora sp. HUAS LYJ1]|uniref:helix-turn-helix domain-containing protein n=1 Tax=Micromonospora sp. HUAS LYJ1 TaxID=3061626 RepID=UPI002672305E|nr:helix-turn-helix transcriptional regulator [Micromonospora sp. HUAS LYJ1]WKU07120.1 helix-turn-helix transcriptional regulator [Micromonospora sp. HUAS LYJ1]
MRRGGVSEVPAAYVGSRIAAARRRRGMSRKVVADLIGRSEEWLRQIENGQRQLDSIKYALRISEVLHLADLMSTLGLQGRQAPGAVALANTVGPLRDAIMSSVGTDVLESRREGHVLEAGFAEQDVAEAWRSWSGRANRYRRTLRLLPPLIHDASAHLREASSTDSVEAAVSVYHLTRTVLSRIGEEQLAWVMADRALVAAGGRGGSLLLASAWHGAVCYLRVGCFIEAYRLALAAVAADQPDSASSTVVTALRGALRLIAAEAAAGILDAGKSHQLLQEAHRLARELPGDLQPHMIPFGRTEVGISVVQVAIRLGRIGEAVQLAAEVDVPDSYLPDRQARHYMTLAFLHARRREDAAAVFALNKVVDISPEDLRYDERCHQILHQLLRRNNLTIRRDLTRLADLAGVG